MCTVQVGIDLLQRGVEQPPDSCEALGCWNHQQDYPFLAALVPCGEVGNPGTIDLCNASWALWATYVFVASSSLATRALSSCFFCSGIRAKWLACLSFLGGTEDGGCRRLYNEASRSWFVVWLLICCPWGVSPKLSCGRGDTSWPPGVFDPCPCSLTVSEPVVFEEDLCEAIPTMMKFVSCSPSDGHLSEISRIVILRETPWAWSTNVLSSLKSKSRR